MSYLISIEPVIGPSFLHGSREELKEATAEAERVFLFSKVKPRTVAVIEVISKRKRKRKIVDVFDGQWLSSHDWWDELRT